MKRLKLLILTLLLSAAGRTIAQTTFTSGNLNYSVNADGTTGNMTAYSDWGGFSSSINPSTTYIKDVMLIGSNSTTEIKNLKAQYQAQGWKLIDKDLNAGCGANSDWIYLLYKPETSPGVNLGYITDFYITDAESPFPDKVVAPNGHTYHIVPYAGGNHFVNIKGDLNSHAGGAYIHLYYTKEEFTDNRAVTNILFNSEQSGGLGVNGDNTEGYDLNEGCGAGSYNIYMHIGKEEAVNPFIIDGLVYAINSDGTSVTLTGHVDGQNATGQLHIPDTVNIMGTRYSVTAIGDNAFNGCNGFTDIVSYAETPPTLGNNVFDGWDTDNTMVYVPCGSGTAYGKINWGGFSNFTEDCQVPTAPCLLVADDYTVFNDEQIFLSWEAITDPGLQKYCVYRDGELIAEATASTYTDGPLAYNMIGYEYYVTAVYESGESAPSNKITVQVSGYGNMNGYVYEQDGVTGIAGATVSLTGNDEFGDTHTYSFTTNSNGYYSSWLIYAGSYNGQASREALSFDPDTNTPIVIRYNQGTQANFLVAKIPDITLGDLLYSINADGTSVTITGHVDCASASGTLTIPASITYQGKSYAVTAIGKDAFSGCANFDNIFSFAQTPPTLGSGSFGGWNTNILVTVPCGSSTAYSSIQWGGFINFTEDCEVPTTVISVDNDAALQGSGKWFTIDGREQPGEPAQGGFYINDGKIILFKP